MKKYQDHYFKRAKQENYAARSVYKLQELDKRFQLLKKGQSVLDLGAAPGSWTQWASQKVGPSGRVLSVDLQAQGTGFDPNVTFMQVDAFSEDPAMLAALKDHAPLGLVLSDMAPKTTGVKFADQARSLELCERALELALQWLAPGGDLVVKIFEGPDVHGFMTGMRAHFDKVKGFKPKSSRSESKETFIVGLGFRPGTE